MNRKFFLLLLAANFTLFFAHAQPGSWRQVGKPGIWGRTICAASSNGWLYTVESTGALYKTNPGTGSYTSLDANNYGNTAILLAGSNYLISVEKDGSLYRTDLVAKKWIRLGKPGEWINTIAAALVADKLYTVEVSGALYATDIYTGVWSKVGEPNFGNTRFMFGSASFLYSIEKDGTLYMISPINGSWKQIGQKGAWVNTIKGTILGDRLLTIESNGTLFETRLSTGIWQQLGKPEFVNTKFLCAGLGKIYSIEANGALYEINVR